MLSMVFHAFLRQIPNYCFCAISSREFLSVLFFTLFPTINKKSRGSQRSPRSSARNTCLRQVCTVSQARRVVAATWLLAAILALPRNWIQVLQDSGHPSILSIHTIHPVRLVRHPTLFSLKPIMPFIQKAIYTIKRCVSRVTSVSSIQSV